MHEPLCQTHILFSGSIRAASTFYVDNDPRDAFAAVKTFGHVLLSKQPLRHTYTYGELADILEANFVVGVGDATRAIRTLRDHHELNAPDAEIRPLIAIDGQVTHQLNPRRYNIHPLVFDAVIYYGHLLGRRPELERHTLNTLADKIEAMIRDDDGLKPSNVQGARTAYRPAMVSELRKLQEELEDSVI